MGESVDWAARFRRAATVAAKHAANRPERSAFGMSVALHELARQADEAPPDAVEAVGRALLGEEFAALLAMRDRAREVDEQKVPSIPSMERNDLAADVARYILGES